MPTGKSNGHLWRLTRQVPESREHVGEKKMESKLRACLEVRRRHLDFRSVSIDHKFFPYCLVRFGK